jgi:crossover junction endodeoxyribonuclease RuvC
LGIDPGLADTGWGIIDAGNGDLLHIDHGVIETKADRPRAERLYFIFASVRSILVKYKPDEAAVETLYFGKNISSAIPVAEARGVVCAAVAERGLILRELTPSAIKLGVAGVARADKRQVQEMARLILGLDEPVRNGHAADALGAAICAAKAIPLPTAI